MKYGIATGLLAAIGGLAAGCGGDHGLPIVPVTGRVTFDGGPPPAVGNITFVQVSGSGVEGLPSRPGRAVFSTNGEYEASTFKDGDGLLPGRYQITITCLDPATQSGQRFEDVSFVPPGYNPDEFVVEQDGGAIEKNFDVPLNTKKK